MKRCNVALIFLALLACRNPVDNFDILVAEGAVEMVPPPSYLELWQKMEACSGLKGDFGAVTWYRTPRIVVGGLVYDGGWLGRQNAIFIVDGRLDNIIVIEHEETHALLRGGIDHPAQYFNGACGDLRVVKENPTQ